MQIEQVFGKMFWKPGEIASLPEFVLSLCVAALLAFLLGQAYVRFGQSLSNRRVFARNFLLLTVTTTLVISIVKSSLALSLGLVGALSIVRFRAAIKEPEELAYLFLAIGIGLGLGAGQVLVTIAAIVLVIGLVALRHLALRNPEQPNLFLTVTSPAAANLSASQVLDNLKAVGASASLRRFDQTAETMEASFLVDFKDVGKLEQFSQKLRQISDGIKISCLDDRGLSA
jgi:hypothetical protein